MANKTLNPVPVTEANSVSRVLDVIFNNTASNGIEPFSEFILRDNPLQAPALAVENKNMYWQTLTQTLLTQPIIMVGTMQRYLIDVSEKVFSCFPIRRDTRGRWRQNIIEFKPHFVPPGTMKVPPREISYTVDSREYTAAYTGEAFEADYSQLQTPEGRELFNMLLSQTVSDVLRVFVYNMYDTLMEEQNAYLSAETRFPYEAHIPDTPQKAFDYFHETQAFALNKSPQMIHNLIAHCNRMFEGQGQPPTAQLIMTEEVKRFIKVMDKTNLDYEDTGPSALGNRTENSKVGSIRNVDVMTIQMLAENNSNPYNDTIFTHRWQTGSVARFIEPSVYVHPSKYRSTDRNGRWSSWYADRPEEFCFLNGLKHMIEFVPLDDPMTDDDEENGIVPGSLNLPFLFGLAANADRMFERTRCQRERNEEETSQFLQYVEGSDKPFLADVGASRDDVAADRHFPILAIGEIAPRFCKTVHLRLPYATMHAAIANRLSVDELATLEAGFALAKRLANPPFVPNRENIELRFGNGSVARSTDVADSENANVTRVQDGLADGLFSLGEVDAGLLDMPYGLGTYHGFLSVLRQSETVNANGDRVALFNDEVREQIAAVVPVFEKLVTVLLEINKTHPALDPDVLPLFYENASAFERTCIAAWNYLVEGGYRPHRITDVNNGVTTANYVFLHFDVDEQGRAKDDVEANLAFDGGLYDVSLPILATNGAVPRATRGFYDYLRSLKLKRLTARMLASSPWQNQYFMERWKSASTQSVWESIAQRTVLLQEVGLSGLQGWWDANVAIPIGQAMVRPFEDIICDSMAATSQKQIGFTALTGLDNIISFDGNTQHYSVQIMGGFRTIPTNHKGFIVLDRIRGRRILGGKGNRYINSNPESTGAKVLRFGTPEFNEIVQGHFGDGELLGAFGMIALAEGYNQSIENPFAERHYPLTGYWEERDFIGMIANSTSFQAVYPKPLGINQFVFNYAFPQFITNKPRGPEQPLRASTAEISEMWRYNTYVHQITQWVKNPLTGNWDEIKSAHACGREENNIRGIQTSIVPVRRAPVKPNRGLAPALVQA